MFVKYSRGRGGRVGGQKLYEMIDKKRGRPGF